MLQSDFVEQDVDVTVDAFESFAEKLRRRLEIWYVRDLREPWLQCVRNMRLGSRCGVFLRGDSKHAKNSLPKIQGGHQIVRHVLTQQADITQPDERLTRVGFENFRVVLGKPQLEMTSSEVEAYQPPMKAGGRPDVVDLGPRF